MAPDLLGKNVVRNGGDVRLTGDYPQRGDVIAYLKEMRAKGAYDALFHRYCPGVRGAPPAFFEKYPSRRRQGE